MISCSLICEEAAGHKAGKWWRPVSAGMATGLFSKAPVGMLLIIFFSLKLKKTDNDEETYRLIGIPQKDAQRMICRNRQQKAVRFLLIYAAAVMITGILTSVKLS